MDTMRSETAERLSSLASRRRDLVAALNDTARADGYGDHSHAHAALAAHDAEAGRLAIRLRAIDMAGSSGVRIDGAAGAGSLVRFLQDGRLRAARLTVGPGPSEEGGILPASLNSPLGSALNGARAGDTTFAELFGEEVELRVVEVL